MILPIVLFHTAQSNVALYDQGLEKYGPQFLVEHSVNAALLARAAGSASLSADLATDIRDQMLSESRGGSLICTCSTLGPIADILASEGHNMLRSDAILADVAVQRGGRIAVLYTVESTARATRDVFDRSRNIGGSDAELNYYLVPGAWDWFLNGQPKAYIEKIAGFANTLDDVDTIVLAQSSMSPAAGILQSATPKILDPVGAVAQYISEHSPQA